MKTSRGLKAVMIALAIVVSLGLLVACGGGGGGGGGSKTQLSGTVAAGAPVSGMVYVEDAFGNITSAVINADGTYKISVKDMEPPFLVYAEGTANGKSVKMYSTALDAGSVNVTPITDFILRNALVGDDPAVIDWTVASALVNAAALEAAEDIVRTQMAPLLTAAGLNPLTVDLMSMKFSADHTGMDLVLDAITISISGTSVTVTNNFTGDSFTDDLATALPDGALTVDTVSAISDAAAIAAIWAALPGNASPGAWSDARIAQDFLDEGMDFAAQRANLILDPIPGGVTLKTYLISNIAASVDLGLHDRGYMVGMEMLYQGISMGTMQSMMVYNATTDAGWYWWGNQQMLSLSEAPKSYMIKYIANDGSISNSSGIQFYFNDRNNYSLGNGVNYLVVNGPGVQGNGRVMKHNGFESYQPLGGGMLTIELNSAEAALIPDNSRYNIWLCSNTANDTTLETADGVDPFAVCSTPLAKYETINPKAPVGWDAPNFLNLGFPTLVAPTSHDITTYNFTSGITVRWANPGNGTLVGHVGVSVQGPSGFKQAEAYDILPTATSTVVDTASFPVETFWQGDIELGAYDVFSRKTAVIFNLFDPMMNKPGR